MSNITSSSSINFTLLNQAINRYVPIPLLFFGIIGNILNILIFTRKIFRQNNCVTYFLVSTIFDSFVIIVGLLPRLLDGFSCDISQKSAILCKLRFFITYLSGYTAAWFISLACVERYLSSSTNVQRRQLITMKHVYLSMVAVPVLGCIVFGEQFYCININQQLLGAPQSCYQLQEYIQCQIVDSIMQFLFEMLTPAMMMIVFGLLTLNNVREQHRRIKAIPTTNTVDPIVGDMTEVSRHPAHTQPINIISDLNKRTVLIKADRTAQKRDAQLITMLLVQVSD